MTFWTKPFISLWGLMGFFTVAVIAVYFAVQGIIETEVVNGSELCNSDFAGYDNFKAPPDQVLDVWIYNMSNPGDFVNGVSSAELLELGPFAYDLKIRRDNIHFSSGGGNVDFVLYNRIFYDESRSCKGCGDIVSGPPLTVLNPAYASILSGSSSEFMLLLATSCTQSQILNLLQNPSLDYCEKTDLNPNTGANCRCCVPTFGATGNVTSSMAFCKDLTNPYNAKASLISWLASYDGGYKLNSIVTSTSFPLSTGLYTPLVRTYSVNELVSGSVSSLAGFLNFAATFNLTDSVSRATVAGIKQTTQDIKDVCYSTQYSFCPQLSTIMATLSGLGTPQQRLAYMKQIKCTGNIPYYEDLMGHGFSEERALELRYLEGVSCTQFSVAIAFSALIMSNPSNSGSCADGGAMPCCLSSFTLTSAAGSTVGKGVGCLRFVDGLVQKRRVFSAEEAEKYLNSIVDHRTICNNKERLRINTFMGQSVIREWFTPTTYTYPNMPWADPTVIRKAGNGVPGTFSNVNLYDGRVLTQMVGTGIGRSFLARNLNGGSVKDEEFDIFLPGINRIRTAKFSNDEYFEGLRSAKYYLKDGDNTPSVTTQMEGQLPYPNMVNLVYSTGGVPVILTMHNFMGVDSAIYTQDNNAKRGYPNGLGVSIFRTHESYDYDAEQIPATPISRDTTIEFKEVFENWWQFEPATGLTVTNQATAMFSLFTMNCNPNIDPSCGLARNESVTTTLCYPFSSGGKQYSSPCSFANVFTPKVQGEKVYPMYWNRVTAAPPEDLVGASVILLDVRYAFSILVVIFSCASFLLILYTLESWRRHNDNGNPAESTRGSMIDMAFRKSTPGESRESDGEVSLHKVHLTDPSTISPMQNDNVA